MIRFDYANMGDALDVVERRPVYSWAPSEDRERQGGWSGSASVADACKLARAGWPEGVQRLDFEVEHAGAPAMTRRRRAGYDVAGDVLDVDSLLRGEAEVYEREAPRARRRSKTLRLTVNVGASCSVDTAGMIRWGAAVVALVDALEAAGQRVALACAFASKGHRDDAATFVCRIGLKDEGDPLHLAAAAFGLAHPSSLRRIHLGVMRRVVTDADNTEHGYGSGMGRPSPVRPDEGETVLPMPTELSACKGGWSADTATMRAALLGWWETTREGAAGA